MNFDIVMTAVKTLNVEVETLKLQVAYEGHHAEELGKTITQIANEYEVSRRTVNRYMEKYEELVVDIDNQIELDMQQGVDDQVQVEDEQAEPLMEEQVEEAFADEPEAEEKVETPKVKPVNVSETYAKIVELEVKSNKGRVRTRPAKNSVAIYEAVNGVKDDFFAKMYEEGKSKSFTEREYRRTNMYIEAIDA